MKDGKTKKKKKRKKEKDFPLFDQSTEKKDNNNNKKKGMDRVFPFPNQGENDIENKNTKLP